MGYIEIFFERRYMMVECVCTKASDCGVIWVLRERE